jgi:hypothetical protein
MLPVFLNIFDYSQQDIYMFEVTFRTSHVVFEVTFRTSRVLFEVNFVTSRVLFRGRKPGLLKLISFHSSVCHAPKCILPSLVAIIVSTIIITITITVISVTFLIIIIIIIIIIVMNDKIWSCWFI